MNSGLQNLKRMTIRIAGEPPLRLLSRELVRVAPASVRTKAWFDAAPYPPYLVSVLWAAREAVRRDVDSLSVVELGVAGGNGLLALQSHAAAVEAETGVRIFVYGFDAGGGLPDQGGDYRDHPEMFRAGDYPMDEARLRAQLTERTELIIGNVADTIPRFVSEIQEHPLGFVSVDLDLYTSTKDALDGLFGADRKTLLHVPVYLDDIHGHWTHRFAGELLAIDDFNNESDVVKIDRWENLFDRRPFSDALWLKKMYLAHDIEAATAAAGPRKATRLDLAV